MNKLKGPDETILNKGQRAPFYGVLTPEERWRQKEESLEVCDIFNQTRCPPQDPCPSNIPEIFQDTLIGVAIGVIGTFLLISPH